MRHVDPAALTPAAAVEHDRALIDGTEAPSRGLVPAGPRVGDLFEWVPHPASMDPDYPLTRIVSVLLQEPDPSARNMCVVADIGSTDATGATLPQGMIMPTPDGPSTARVAALFKRWVYGVTPWVHGTTPPHGSPHE